MAGSPKKRERMMREAEQLGLTLEEYREMKAEERRTEQEKREAEAAKKKEARTLRENVKQKRNELSEWMVSFVSSNMRKHGQAIFESLLQDDPKGAASFLTQMMKFAAPTVSDPEKLDSKKPEEEKEELPEYEEAKRKIEQLKRQFKKD
jgi:hypothetical protein